MVVNISHYECTHCCGRVEEITDIFGKLLGYKCINSKREVFITERKMRKNKSNNKTRKNSNGKEKNTKTS